MPVAPLAIMHKITRIEGAKVDLYQNLSGPYLQASNRIVARDRHYAAGGNVPARAELH
jgi:hypothetical protein